MTYRSIGRQYDWDLEKFRAAPKSIDVANKKRLTKNFLRFVKHPGGYFYWKLNKRLNKMTWPAFFAASFFVNYFFFLSDASGTL